jgi:hypothetical protein
MTRHWEPTTLKLTAKQARVLWYIVEKALREDWNHGAGTGRSLAAILRKLEGTR